jgi:hypothetical protein
MATLKVQLLLRPEHRNDRGVVLASAAAAALGLKVTSTGRVAISAELDETEFAVMFGGKVRAVPARRGTGRDFGSPGGFEQEEETLSVPAPLAELVESVGVAAPYTRV